MSKETLTINPKVLFPGVIPNLGMKVISFDDVIETLKELKTLSGKVSFEMESGECSPLNIEVITEEQAVLALDSKFNNKSIRKSDYYLIFSNEITITEFEWQEHNDGEIRMMTIGRDKLFYEQQFSDFFVSEVRYFLFLSNLAKAGHIFTKEGAIIYPFGVSRSIEKVACFLDEAVKIADKVKWSQIKKLDILKVWNWARNFNCGRDRFGYTPVGRALCAFSYLFDDRNFSSNISLRLFWAMVGLESLYTDGKGDLTHQIAEKTQIILGEQTEFKKLVKNMYAHRSKFVHGDVPFPSYFFEGEIPEYNKFSNEIGEAANMATAILIASLQYLIEKDWKELSFKYTILQSN